MGMRNIRWWDICKRVPWKSDKNECILLERISKKWDVTIKLIANVSSWVCLGMVNYAVSIYVDICLGFIRWTKKYIYLQHRSCYSIEYFLNTFQNDDALNSVKSMVCKMGKDFESPSRYLDFYYWIFLNMMRCWIWHLHNFT